METQLCILVFSRLLLTSVAITSLYTKGADGQGVKAGGIPEPAGKAGPAGNKQILRVTAAPGWQVPADKQESLYFTINSFPKYLSVC